MDLWYKNAIVYGVIVEVFKDGNGDGIGDFIGLTQQLDYLQHLGITCIWLLPFYPTSGRDNGYDVTDYYDVDPRLGTMDEFKHFMREAEKRQIRVIIDLVVHHTSIHHQWFQESKNKKSKYRDYYIWRDVIPEGDHPPSAFPGIEPGVWQYDSEAKAYYYHSFYHFQPDLNIRSKDVQDEVLKIADFWLGYGISGFRIDAASLMFDRKGEPGMKVADPEEGLASAFLEKMHNFIHVKNPEAIMLGEADVAGNKVSIFFGDGGRMQLLYNFLLNRYIFLGFAREDGRPIVEELNRLPVPPHDAQWVNFLRNHDELNIERLSKKEQDDVFQKFGPSRYMRAYGRGIRRRLAPMFDGDMRRLRMAYSLLFSLPGAPLLIYGDEIGMGDNLELPERVAVRTPMQWNNGKNAGFSEADKSVLIRQLIDKGDFSYEHVNVEDEDKDVDSVLRLIKALIAVRKTLPEIGEGVYRTLSASPGNILVLSYTTKDRVIIIVHNLHHEPCTVVLDDFKHAVLIDRFSDGNYLHKEEKATTIFMHGYGFRWFEVKGRDDIAKV